MPMTTAESRHRTGGTAIPDLEQTLAAYLAGDRGAGEVLCAALRRELELVAASLLGAGAPEAEDAVQDSLLAILNYLRRTGRFNGRIQAFAATVVRNRCLDLLRHRRRYPNVAIDTIQEGIQDAFMDPLDRMIADEGGERLRRAWEMLDPPCRELLGAIFHKDKSVKELRVQMRVKSVQVIYYRKGACLRRLLAILQNQGSVVEEPERSDGPPRRRKTEE